MVFVGDVSPALFLAAGFGNVGSSSSVIRDRFNGDAVAGRDGDMFFEGDAVVGLVGERGPFFAEFGLGRGGKVNAEVPGRESAFSLPLRRLSGRAHGNSRRGGISCSRVSGMASVNGVDRRALAGRGSAASDDSRA